MSHVEAQLFISPYGGVIADRFNKRKLLFITQSSSGILALILGLLVLTNTVQIWMVYVLALSLGIINSFDVPLRQTFVPEMVGVEHVKNAVTLFAILVNLAQVIGPAFGGIIIATLGLATCFFFNAASFLAVIIALLFMRKEELKTVPPVPKRKGQLIEGINYIKSTPQLYYLLLMMFVIGTLSYEFQVSLPLFAKFTLNGDAGTYAALSSAVGLGAVFGGMLTARRKDVNINHLFINAFIYGLLVLAVSLTPNIYIAFIALMTVGFFSIMLISQSISFLQLESNPEMRGRVMSFWSVAFLGSTAVGGPLIGYICEHASPRWGIAVGGVSAIIASLVGYFMFKRYMRYEHVNKNIIKL